ncbi:ribonuclease H-like domain-containing protein [Tanacetum coccineum]|uniref:Ribonuclease H-like domain-containing protein n=1 Tax=Tanacetum coccineum TaxID=301880 RepID=A0ABQ5J7I1_9ASTR
MRNKSDLDTLSMDELYNNLKVYEAEIKTQSLSSSNPHNVAFMSSDNSSSINETVNTAHSVSAASSKDQATIASCADDVIFSFFSNQFNSPQLDNEDLEQIDTNDLEEMDLKWQLAILTMRVKRFINKTRRNLNFNGKETVGFDKTKVECYNCHRKGHFARECRVPRNQGNRNRDSVRRVVPVETSTNALVVQDEIALQKQYDQQREALNKSNLEIIGYQMGLESLEARIVVHEKNEGVYEESIVFLEYDVQFPLLLQGTSCPQNLTYVGIDETTFMSVVRKTTTSVSETEASTSKTSNDIAEKPNTVRFNNVTTTGPKTVVNAAKGKKGNAVKFSACWIWRPKGNGHPLYALQDQGIFDSGCSRHMTGNKLYLSDYQDIDGVFVAFGESAKGVPGPQYVLLPFLTSDSQCPKNSEDKVADDAGKKNEVEDPAKEDDINGPREATDTNSTNRLNTVSSLVNTRSSSFTTVDPGRARDQRNKFESMFGQDKDANSNYRIFNPVSAVESSYENVSGSTPVNTATPSNDDYPIDPLMLDLEDTIDLQDTGIFGNAYNDENVGAEDDLNNLETNISDSPILTTRIHKDHPKE